MKTNNPLDHFVSMLKANQCLKSARLEHAVRAAPRQWFVDQMHTRSKYLRFIDVNTSRPTKHQLERIYSDEPLLIRRDPPSSTSQPSLVMNMLEALDIRPGARVLEIGAGTGWNAALMAHLVESSGSVVSIDNQPDVARSARRHIKRAGLKNVHIVTGDGANGHPKAAPYDRLITTVSCPDVFPAWLQQLKPSGIAVITLSELPGESWCLMLKLRKAKTHLTGEVANLTGFMLFTGQHGTPPTASQAQQRLDEHAGAKVRKHRAVWAILPGQGDIAMRRDLAFFAHLEGLRVESLGNRFVLSAPDHRGLCVLDNAHIDVIGGTECYRLYEKIQDKWLHLGAPKRLQYRVEVWPLAVKKRHPRDGWLTRRAHCQLIFRLKQGVSPYKEINL